jgi:hypothetical protein
MQRRRIYSRLAQPARGTALPRIVNAIRLMLESIAYGQLTSWRLPLPCRDNAEAARLLGSRATVRRPMMGNELLLAVNFTFFYLPTVASGATR